MNDFQILPVSDIHMRRVFHLPILEIVGEKSGLIFNFSDTLLTNEVILMVEDVHSALTSVK